MKVLVVTNMYPHAENPVLGCFLKLQVESIRAKGVDVDVLFVNGPKSKLNYAVGVLRFHRQIRSKRYDLIHAHYHFSAYIARTQFRLPIILTHWGPELVYGWEKPLCHLITPLVDGVIVVSPEGKTILGDSRIRVIEGGIDLELFQPSDQLLARQTLGLPVDRKLVLWAAAINSRKRLDRAQQAVAILNRTMPDAQLVIATKLPPERIPLYMNACDTLVLTSEAEGSPQVVKEAMACNLPVVSVDVGDVRDVIGGTDGCYIARKDPADIAQKLEAALLRNQRTNGRQAVARFGLPPMADAVIDFYQQVLQRKRIATAVDLPSNH
jgi:glycosyltransferase involved in cell wall biosynthesis